MGDKSIDKQTAVLIRAIKNLECYKKYCGAKDAVMANEHLKTRVAEFKELNYNYNMKKINNQEPTFDEQRYVSHLYWQLMLDERTKCFLESEKELGSLVQDMFEEIAGETGLDINFFV